MTSRKIPIEDNFASGWRPGQHGVGNEAEGYIATLESISGLVPVPWKYGQFEVLSTSGSLPTLRSEAYRNNSDGSNQAITVTIAAAASSTACDCMRIRFQFSGKVFALRWAKGYDSGATPKNFSAVIDGVAYEVDNSYIRDFVYSQSLLASDLSLPQHMPLYPNGDTCVVIADDLPDGPHMCELVFQGNANGGATQRWVIYGYACESRVGYQQPQHFGGWCRAQSLAVAGTYYTPDFVHPLNASDTTNYPKAIAAIHYYNSSGAAVTVTIRTWYNNATAEIIDVISVPAGGVAKFEPKVPFSIDRSAAGSGATASGTTMLQHSASNTGVTAKVLGIS